MSLQSDAAKTYIEMLLAAEYGLIEDHHPAKQRDLEGKFPQEHILAFREYRFHPTRKWRFDYAVPLEMTAIEIDGGIFVRGAHANPSAIRANYEKLNAAAAAGWRVWRFLPEQIIKAGRKGIEANHTSYVTPIPLRSAKLCLMNQYSRNFHGSEL